MKQETTLMTEDTVSQVLGDIKDHKEHLENENLKLQQRQTRLESDCKRLGQIEKSLRHFVGEQNSEYARMIALTDEHEKLFENIREEMKKKALQEIVFLALECDVDRDFKLENDELENFLLRLTPIEEITFEEDALRTRIMEKGTGLEDVIGVVKKLLAGTVDDGDNRSLSLKKVSPYMNNRHFCHKEMLASPADVGKSEYFMLTKGISEADFFKNKKRRQAIV